MTDAPFTETQKDWRLNEAQAEIDRLSAIQNNLSDELDRVRLERDGFQHTLRQANIQIDRLRSALTAIETLYATRGWSDGFRERLRQILDGVKTP